MNWPNDADGDVFRRLHKEGFDFSASSSVDFNVDFDEWPPSSKAIERLQSIVGNLEIVEPDGEFGGYLAFQVNMQLNYERVTSIQREVSEVMEPFGGVCESWGVLS